MKTILKSVLLIPGLLFAQAEAQEGFHEHDGFFLSLCAGPALGAIVLDASGAVFNKMEFAGPGGMVDFKIGGTIAKTVSLSFDIISRSIVGPDIEADGTTVSASEDVSANDVLLGLGVTYYIMPINIFLSGTIGSSAFTLRDDGNDVKATSERGVGFQVKVGKEWWVGKNWGLGVSGGFSRSTADDKKDPDNSSYSGEMSTNKVFVMFNTTYN